MTTYVLEMRSTADWKDCRYREYTTSKKKADLFEKVPRIPFTDSGHGIVPYVREHQGRREPRNMILQDHVVDSIKAMTREETAKALRRAAARPDAGCAVKALEWHPSAQLPDIKAGTSRQFIVAVYRKHSDKVYSFAAEYLNEYLLRYEWGCPKDKEGTCVGCEDGCPTTGWFVTEGADDDGYTYHGLNLTDGDRFEGWREIPRWEDRAFLEQPATPGYAAGFEACREAAGYAERLALALWEKHYRHSAPNWKPLSNDLVGLLTQIDNMTAALSALPAPAPAAEVMGWQCMGRKQSLPEPGECNWPDCGCDPHATKVIESLIEQGWRAPPEPLAWDHPHNRQYEPVERRAKEIYDAFVYDGPPGTVKPAWTPGGNGTKQDEARDIARHEIRFHITAKATGAQP